MHFEPALCKLFSLNMAIPSFFVFAFFLVFKMKFLNRSSLTVSNKVQKCIQLFVFTSKLPFFSFKKFQNNYIICSKFQSNIDLKYIFKCRPNSVVLKMVHYRLRCSLSDISQTSLGLR